MALHAVLEVPNAFLYMLRPHLGLRVLVAAVAGVAAVVVVGVAGHATHVVVTIQDEQLVVLERRRPPAFLAVALLAVAQDLLM